MDGRSTAVSKRFQRIQTICNSGAAFQRKISKDPNRNGDRGTAVSKKDFTRQCRKLLWPNLKKSQHSRFPPVSHSLSYCRVTSCLLKTNSFWYIIDYCTLISFNSVSTCKSFCRGSKLIGLGRQVASIPQNIHVFGRLDPSWYTLLLC